jgi:hypothetical protein
MCRDDPRCPGEPVQDSQKWCDARFFLEEYLAVQIIARELGARLDARRRDAERVVIGCER